MYEVKPEGSLGLLALGDVGLLAWRAKRDEKADLKTLNPNPTPQNKR